MQANSFKIGGLTFNIDHGSKSCSVDGEPCDIREVADKLKEIMDRTAKTPDTVSNKAVNVSLFSDQVFNFIAVNI